MAYIFDGSTKRITLSSVTLDLVDLHSRWKDWLLLGNAGFEQAFKAVGGDIQAIPLYLFLLNGWRIVPMAADHTLAVTNGVLEVDGGGDPFVDPAGSYKIRINRQTPGIAIGYSSSGTSGPSADSIAAAVLSALNATTIPVDAEKMNGADIDRIVSALLVALNADPIPVNIKKVNNIQIKGIGTRNDPWNPI